MTSQRLHNANLLGLFAAIMETLEGGEGNVLIARCSMTLKTADYSNFLYYIYFLSGSNLSSPSIVFSYLGTMTQDLSSLYREELLTW